AEGIVSVYWGSGDDAISLLGFGIDSFIEVASAALVLSHILWEFSSRRRANAPETVNKSQTTLMALERERKLTFIIGLLLALLAISVVASAIVRLVQRTTPDSTVPGMFLKNTYIVAALTGSIFLFYFKTRAAVILNSSALTSEANCTLSCIKLSTILLIGSLIYAIDNRLWWVDGTTSICIGLRVGYEGILTIRQCFKKEFTGGCGCCSGSDSYLAKYWRKRIEQEYNMDAPKISTTPAKVCAKGCCENVVDTSNEKEKLCKQSVVIVQQDNPTVPLLKAAACEGNKKKCQKPCCKKSEAEGVQFLTN
ncbi:hypothetical protein RFI_03482, partial [Reticulomyxa filosa]